MFTLISWLWDFYFLRKSTHTSLEMCHKERLAFPKGAGGIGCWIGGRVAALPWCKPLVLWWIYTIHLGVCIQNVWKSFPELFWKCVPVKWLILCYWPFVLLNPFVVVLPLKVKPNPVFLSSFCFSCFSNSAYFSVCVCFVPEALLLSCHF